MKATTVTVDGMPVVAEVSGAGPAVLLVPGGATTCHGYYPHLVQALTPNAAVIETDRPGVGRTRDRRSLRLPDAARHLAQVVRAVGGDPVLVVGHSLGGLVALQLAVQDPDLVAALVLLDPTPLTPARLLKAQETSLKVLAGLGPVGRKLWNSSAKNDLGGMPLDNEQQRAVAIYTERGFMKDVARWAGHLAADGGRLAAALAAGQLAKPTVLVSAGGHGTASPIRKAHEQFVQWIPGAELRVWEGTRHPLHIQQPDHVAKLVGEMLTRSAG
jgi:pimeloyl-ACP methyl ester carboxylesterase